MSTVDRSATFDNLVTSDNSLRNYTEDSLFITVDDLNFQGIGLFEPNDPRTTAYHYGTNGNFEYVSIRGTDDAVMTSVDFLVGHGEGGTMTNVRWETWLDGALVDTGTESNIGKGLVVGWSDTTGFDELRVAAGISESQPGFGNFQAIAIDDLKVELSAVPLPASIWLFCYGLLGLIGITIRKNTA